MATSSILLLIGLLAVAAVMDIRAHRIPNAITLGGTAAAFLIALATDGWGGLLPPLLGMFAGMALFLPAHLMGHMGAGDVKLMGMVGAFLGPYEGIVAAAASVLMGALMALLLLLVSEGRNTAWARYSLMLRTLVTTGRVAYQPPGAGDAAGRRFAYAVAIAAGTLITLAWGGHLKPFTVVS